MTNLAHGANSKMRRLPMLASTLVTLMACSCATSAVRDLRTYTHVERILDASEPSKGTFLVALRLSNGDEAVYLLSLGDTHSTELLPPLHDWAGSLPPSISSFTVFDPAPTNESPAGPLRRLHAGDSSRRDRKVSAGDDWVLVADRSTDSHAAARVIAAKELDWSSGRNYAFVGLIVPASAVDIVTCPIQALYVMYMILDGKVG